MMKMMKKLFTLMAAAAVLSVAMTACQTKGRLAEIAEQANKQCPISMGMSGNIVSVEFDGEDIVYNAVLNDEIVDIDLMEANKEMAKRGALQIFANPSKDIKVMVDELKSAQAGMKIVYKSAAKNKTFTLKLSLEEITNALSNPEAQVDPEEYLKNQIEMTAQSYPEELGDGMTLTALVEEGNNLVYICELDENVITVADIEESRSAAEESLRQTLAEIANDPAAKMFVRSCIETGRNICYRYVESKSGKSTEFVIDPREL